MPKPVEDIHPEVISLDLVDIASGIAMDNPVAAKAVVESIKGMFGELASQPSMGTLYHPGKKVLNGIRMIPATPYRNYLIFYRPLPEDVGVRILYVLHGARDIAQVMRESGRQ